MRRVIVKVQDWLDHQLRQLCGGITPERRLAVVLTMFVLFTLASLYIFVAAIYQIGKNEEKRIEIEHIKTLQFQSSRDSINHINSYNHDRTRE